MKQSSETCNSINQFTNPNHHEACDSREQSSGIRGSNLHTLRTSHLHRHREVFWQTRHSHRGSSPSLSRGRKFWEICWGFPLVQDKATSSSPSVLLAQLVSLIFLGLVGLACPIFRLVWTLPRRLQHNWWEVDTARLTQRATRVAMGPCSSSTQRHRKLSAKLSAGGLPARCIWWDRQWWCCTLKHQRRKWHSHQLNQATPSCSKPSSTQRKLRRQVEGTPLPVPNCSRSRESAHQAQQPTYASMDRLQRISIGSFIDQLKFEFLTNLWVLRAPSTAMHVEH